MHKGVILLVAADGIAEAKEAAESFMDEYADAVYDWYQIGGRWSGTLTGFNPEDDPDNREPCGQCNGAGCPHCEGGGTTAKWPTEWAEREDDILPLERCLNIVREWRESQETEEEFLAYAEEYKESSHDPYSRAMRGYYMKRAASIMMEEFCFSTNVFNVEYKDYSIPDDVDGFYAVMIDMHN